MSESQDHLYFWYPKCVEASAVIEHIIETLAQFLVIWRRPLDLYKKGSLKPRKMKNTGKLSSNLSYVEE